MTQGGAAGTAVQPLRGLITGDAACPPTAPTNSDCRIDAAACVYRGIAVGLSSTDQPMTCRCEENVWRCVSSNESGQTLCPAHIPSSDLGAVIHPLEGGAAGDTGDSCPPQAALPCFYALFEQTALAACYCTDASGSAPGAAWACGL